MNPYSQPPYDKPSGRSVTTTSTPAPTSPAPGTILHGIVVGVNPYPLPYTLKTSPVPPSNLGKEPTAIPEPPPLPRLTDKKIAIYSTFCGANNNIAFVVNRHTKFPCYMFSNNESYLHKAAEAGWIPVLLTQFTPPNPSDVVSATQAKYAKARPELLPELAPYDFLFYVDTKVLVPEDRLEGHVAAMLAKDSPIGIRHHPFLPSRVWAEYDEALKQHRYAIQQPMMHSYIQWRLSDPTFKPEGPGIGHYWTSAILRNMRHPDIKRINEMWASDIEKCGIECQVSFFFVAQTVPNLYVLPQGL
eukprot:PhF_6_TR44501/c0_g2_i1/m.68539